MYVTNLKGPLDMNKLMRDSGYDDGDDGDSPLYPIPAMNANGGPPRAYGSGHADGCACGCGKTDNREVLDPDNESLGYGFNGTVIDGEDEEIRGPNFRTIGNMVDGGELTFNDADADDVLPLPYSY